MQQPSPRARLGVQEGKGAEVATRPSSYLVRRNSGYGGCDASMDSSDLRTDGLATIPLERVTFKSFWQVLVCRVRSGAASWQASEDWPVAAFAGVLAAAVALLSVALA